MLQGAPAFPGVSDELEQLQRIWGVSLLSTVSCLLTWFNVCYSISFIAVSDIIQLPLNIRFIVKNVDNSFQLFDI